MIGLFVSSLVVGLLFGIRFWAQLELYERWRGAV